MPDKDDTDLDLLAYFVLSRRFRAQKKNKLLNAILLDDLAYDALFLAAHAKEAAVQASARALALEISNTDLGAAAVKRSAPVVDLARPL